MRKKVPLPQIEKTLRKRFTKFDGWDLLEGEGKGPDLVFEQKFKNKLLKAFCVAGGDEVTPETLSQVQEYAKALSGKDVEVFAKILAVPERAKVPEPIKKKMRDGKIELLILKES